MNAGAKWAEGAAAANRHTARGRARASPGNDDPNRQIAAATLHKPRWLIGVDWSPVAVEAATGRTSSFVPSDRARFLVGDLTATGLADRSAEAVVCLDAVFFAEDRIAALREVNRLLGSGGRYAFTAPETDPPTRPAHVPDWTPSLEAAGLKLESKEDVPHFAEQLGRMYALWLEHLDELRAELGESAAERLETEAHTVAPALSSRLHLFIVARRPP
jgi:ubiquinone/menaquinone biosynthesis C-methylase UbiE